MRARTSCSLRPSATTTGTETEEEGSLHWKSLVAFPMFPDREVRVARRRHPQAARRQDRGRSHSRHTPTDN